MLVYSSSLFGDKFEDFKLIDEKDQKSKKLVSRGGGGGRSGGSRSSGSRSSGRSSSKSSMRSGGSRSSGRSSSRSSMRSGSRSSGSGRSINKRSGSNVSKSGRTASGKQAKSRSASGQKLSKSRQKSGKSNIGKSGKSNIKSSKGINKSGKGSKVGKGSKAGKGGKAGKGSKAGKGGKGQAGKGSKLGKGGNKSKSRSNKIASHHRGHGGRGGHGGHHGRYWSHHGGYWGHGWGYGWGYAAAFWGGAFFGFAALAPFCYPFGGYWGPYWATPWPWATGLGLYYYPGSAWWYMNSYDCWAYPFASLGYGLMFADLGYYWYPRAGVSIYLEVPEKEDDPSTYVFVENEKDEDLYYALYRKVDRKSGDEESSYLIRVSAPQVIDTRKTVKVILPEDVSKDKEYVVIARRDESELKNNMDEKGNDIDTNIINQIKKEDKDLVRAHDVNVEEPSEQEVQELGETKQSARANEEELVNAIDNIENQDKSELPTEEQLKKEQGKVTSQENQQEKPVRKTTRARRQVRPVEVEVE